MANARRSNGDLLRKSDEAIKQEAEKIAAIEKTAVKAQPGLRGWDAALRTISPEFPLDSLSAISRWLSDQLEIIRDVGDTSDFLGRDYARQTLHNFYVALDSLTILDCPDRPADSDREPLAFIDAVRAIEDRLRWLKTPDHGVNAARAADIPTLLDDGIVRVGANHLRLDQSEAAVLSDLVKMQSANLPDLKLATGNDYPARVLKTLRKKYNGVLSPFIRLPGGKGRGGYSTTIVDGRRCP